MTQKKFTYNQAIFEKGGGGGGRGAFRSPPGDIAGRRGPTSAREGLDAARRNAIKDLLKADAVLFQDEWSKERAGKQDRLPRNTMTTPKYKKGGLVKKGRKRII